VATHKQYQIVDFFNIKDVEDEEERGKKKANQNLL
jgi:hypothetical protein